MARKTTIADVRGKDTRELLYDLGELRKQLFHQRFHPQEETKKTSGIRTLRRQIARVLTVIRERQRLAAAEQGASQS